jgi:magnesium transporter
VKGRIVKQQPGSAADSSVTPAEKKPGMSPGSLVYTGARAQEQVSLQLIQFTEHAVTRRDEAAIVDLLAGVDPRQVNWINVNGLHDTAVVEALGSNFAIDPLVLEDILHTEHMPKLEDHERYLFLTLKMLTRGSDPEPIELEHVSMVLGENYLITFQEKNGDVFDVIRQGILNEKGRLRKRGADYLFYRLLDTIVDHYFVLLDHIEDNLEELEEVLLENAPDSISETILAEKKRMILLRRNILPLREALRTFKQRDIHLINESTYGFLDDVLDHVMQISQTLESFRELVTSLMELHMTVNANKMNNVMKTLTIFAAIFMPLTFIAGIYGMNFDRIPELRWPWGYPLVLAVMGLVAVGMLVYMKRRKWM